MKRRKREKPGYGRLLDAWVPPRGAGDPVGCVATTFTFQPNFFEEECLARFAGLESDPQQDGPLYVIEREERLAGLACAAVLVDAHHCRGPRSLRWDMLPARFPKGGLLHAKVAILKWRQVVRLIVASANITADGYRRNREVFGVLDYRPGGEAPLECLKSMVDFLRVTGGQEAPGRAGSSPGVKRWLSFLKGIDAIPEDWGSTGQDSVRGVVRVRAIHATPQSANVLEQLREVWPSGSPPRNAEVISPFFDPPDGPNQPAEAIWDVLAQRGEASVTYGVIADEVPGEDALSVRAPKSLLDSRPSGRRNVSVHLKHILEEQTGDRPEESRSLHLKSIWLESDTTVAYMIGSSNFTRGGLGIGGTGNREANLVYFLRPDSNRAAFKELMASRPKGDLVDSDREIRWEAMVEEDEDTATDQASALPNGFLTAVYDRGDKGAAWIELRFALEQNLPSGWRLELADDREAGVFYGEAQWMDQGRPESVRIDWPAPRPPSGFNVVWPDCGAGAWWPVQVESGASLPPPDELKLISLELMIQILTSARPLHEVIGRWRRRRQAEGESGSGHVDVAVDPHARVDVSGFILQRTRRVSGALRALRERLERPVISMDALVWRLYGPVGVRKLAELMWQEAKSDAEKAFLTAELALDLSRVRPRKEPGCLDPSVVTGQFKKLISELQEHALATMHDTATNLESYVRAAFQEALR